MRGTDITGQRYGMLVALHPVEKSKNGTWKWRCKCDCGTEKVLFMTALRSGGTTSCGCNRGKNKKHGFHGSPTYLSWKSMKARCSNRNSPDYSGYGGRGISYDPRWESFEIFLADMGVRPDGLTLDRINNDEDYGPSNCKWSTPKEQANNRRDNIKKGTNS